MRIGILTQPLHNNYGGLLQNYALQEVLRKMGHTVMTLDVQYQQYRPSPFLRCVKFIIRLLRKIKGDKNILFVDVVKQVNFYNCPQNHQAKFINKYIEVKSFSSPLDKTFWESDELDALVVGSDQVWRCRFSPYILNYFLDFAEGKSNLKRISYAASFGVDYWDGGNELVAPIKLLLQQFDAISVREESGIGICRETFSNDAKLVLDPTLLLTAEDYKQILPECQNSSVKTCAVYILDPTSDQIHRVNEICHEKGLTVRYIGRPNRKGFPSIESWLSEIFSAEYVITDSFHGTVFSILAHKRFTTIVNSSRGAARFETLLSMLDLKDRMVTDNGTLINDMQIDYEKVETILTEQRKLSYEFLSSNLG